MTRLHDALWAVCNEGGRLQHKVETDVLTVTRSDITAGLDDVKEVYGTEPEDWSDLLYECTDRSEVYCDDRALTVSFPHIADALLPAMRNLYRQHCAQNSASADELTDQQANSLVDPSGSTILAGVQHRVNESLVAMSLANATTPCDAFSLSEPITAHWLVRHASTGAESADSDLILYQPDAWTGELFKEVPDIGSDLVRIVKTCESPLRLRVERVQVKLASVGQCDAAQIRCSGGPEVNARTIVSAFARIEGYIERRLRERGAADVEMRRVLVTARGIPSGGEAAKVLAGGRVAVLDRAEMAGLWLPSIVNTACASAAPRVTQDSVSSTTTCPPTRDSFRTEAVWRLTVPYWLLDEIPSSAAQEWDYTGNSQVAELVCCNESHERAGQEWDRPARQRR